jgi:hypothetical protein
LWDELDIDESPGIGRFVYKDAKMAAAQHSQAAAALSKSAPLPDMNPNFVQIAIALQPVPEEEELNDAVPMVNP